MIRGTRWWWHTDDEDTVTKGTKKHQYDAFWYIQVFLGLVWNRCQNEKAPKTPKNTKAQGVGKTVETYRQNRDIMTRHKE